MESIKNSINIFLSKSFQNNQWKISLIKNWPKIIGNLHTKISLQKIYHNSVVIGVYDNHWMQELYLMSKLILKKINNHLKEPKITNIRFQYLEKQTKKRSKKKQQLHFTKPVHLSANEEKALQKIHDQELSTALKSFLERCLQ